jgi:hypothetical protein
MNREIGKMSLSWEDSEAHCQRCTSLTRQGRDILCEFWQARTWVATMPQRMVSSMLSPEIWHRFLSVHLIRSSVPSKPK